MYNFIFEKTIHGFIKKVSNEYPEVKKAIIDGLNEKVDIPISNIKNVMGKMDCWTTKTNP